MKNTLPILYFTIALNCTMKNHKIIHKTFHHIVNSSVRSSLKKYDEKTQVYVEEKVDGSNFYFASDGINVLWGKKGSTMSEDTSFYGCQKILYLMDRMMRLYQKLDIKNATLYLYGELIPTQKRIRYITDFSVHFIAFNLRVLPFDQENDENVPVIWLPKQQWYDIAIECGFKVIPTLFTGTLQECLDFDVENTKSCVPQLIDPKSTLISPIEGVVIKGPNFTFKKKATSFREIESGGGIVLKRQEKDEVTVAIADLIGSMLTTSRLDNIVSQIGDKMIPDPHRLSNTVVMDAIEEARDDEESVVYKASKSKLSKIQKELAVLFEDTVKIHMGW